MVFKVTTPIRRKQKMPVKKGYKGNYKKVMKQLLRVYLPRESGDRYVFSALLGGGNLTVICRDGKLYFICDYINKTNEDILSFL